MEKIEGLTVKCGAGRSVAPAGDDGVVACIGRHAWRSLAEGGEASSGCIAEEGESI